MGLNEHQFTVDVFWTGNRGTGTSTYKDYGRDHSVTAVGLPTILGSADRTFHGDKDRWNPELLLVTALSECHMLSYLHVAAKHGVVVTTYQDTATGTLKLHPNGSGEFSSVTLNPQIRVADPDSGEVALSLHEEASTMCFIARSVNFPVHHTASLLGPTQD